MSEQGPPTPETPPPVSKRRRHLLSGIFSFIGAALLYVPNQARAGGNIYKDIYDAIQSAYGIAKAWREWPKKGFDKLVENLDKYFNQSSEFITDGVHEATKEILGTMEDIKLLKNKFALTPAQHDEFEKSTGYFQSQAEDLAAKVGSDKAAAAIGDAQSLANNSDKTAPFEATKIYDKINGGKYDQASSLYVTISGYDKNQQAQIDLQGEFLALMSEVARFQKLESNHNGEDFDRADVRLAVTAKTTLALKCLGLVADRRRRSKVAISDEFVKAIEPLAPSSIVRPFKDGAIASIDSYRLNVAATSESREWIDSIGKLSNQAQLYRELTFLMAFREKLKSDLLITREYRKSLLSAQQSSPIQVNS